MRFGRPLLVTVILLSPGPARGEAGEANPPTNLVRLGADDAAAQVAALYRQAAADGDAVSLVRLGYLYETGDGVPHDYTTARRLYLEAVEAGVVEARLRLALCHLEGWGGPVDREAFVAELTAAAEAGHGPAQRILSTIHFLGFVVPKDRAVALAWMERAAREDDAMAQHELGRQLASTHGRARKANLAAARGWYQLSAEQEYTASMTAMASTFLTGDRREQDWQLARQWLLLAD
jgi:TPR repeat protein